MTEGGKFRLNVAGFDGNMKNIKMRIKPCMSNSCCLFRYIIAEQPYFVAVAS